MKGMFNSISFLIKIENENLFFKYNIDIKLNIKNFKTKKLTRNCYCKIN